MAATQSIPILFTTAVNPALRETSGRDGAFYFVCGASANNNNPARAHEPRPQRHGRLRLTRATATTPSVSSLKTVGFFGFVSRTIFVAPEKNAARQSDQSSLRLSVQERQRFLVELRTLIFSVGRPNVNCFAVQHVATFPLVGGFKRR